MSETKFTRAVLDLARKHWLLAHFCRDPRRCDGSGFPDLIIVGENGLIFAELKSDDGDTSPDQDLWLWTLQRAFRLLISRASAVVWRQADLDSGRIETMMKAIK